MGTTALVSDSTCYLDAREAAGLGVQLVPLRVVLDGVDLPEPEVDRRALWRLLREAGAPPTTSQPSPGAFLEAFEAAAAGGAERVLCVTCTASVSGTHQSAVLAAGMAQVPVDVVDSGTISGGLRLVVTALSEALAAGTPHEQVVALAGTLGGQVRSTWCSDTQVLLAAGGRLHDKVPDGVPVLALDGTDGAVRVLGSARSVEQAVRLQADVVTAAARRHPTRVTVGHGDVAALADALEDALQGARGVIDVDRYLVGAVVGAHAGAGNVGASWFAGQDA